MAISYVPKRTHDIFGYLGIVASHRSSPREDLIYLHDHVAPLSSLHSHDACEDHTIRIVLSLFYKCPHLVSLTGWYCP
ncbi:Uncharacterized protein HZ326_8461 [Fusarium oxysporum f. sp. albedinis]|nr:Uncharacterized protein HZ326_8461 [Fusarium oxysporum f. sp. albedinis]